MTLTMFPGISDRFVPFDRSSYTIRIADARIRFVTGGNGTMNYGRLTTLAAEFAVS